MSGRVVLARRVSPAFQAGSPVRRFLRGEDGGATVDYVVVTGLVAAVSAVLLLNLSSGTSEAAGGIGEGLSRSLAIQNASQDRPVSGSGAGGRTYTFDPGETAGYGSGGSQYGQSGTAGASSGGQQPSPVAPGSDAGSNGASDSAGQDTASADGNTDASSGEARAEASQPPASATTVNVPAEGNGKGNGNSKSDGSGKGNGKAKDDSDDEDEDDVDVACGLGKGNASSTGNANASDRAKRTPAYGC